MLKIKQKSSMKDLFGGLNNRLNMIDKRINELQDWPKEIIQNKILREK